MPTDRRWAPAVDRFVVRLYAGRLESWASMRQVAFGPRDVTAGLTPFWSLQDVREAQAETQACTLPLSLDPALERIWTGLRAAGIDVSTRRFQQAQYLARAVAVLDGRDEVEPKDLLILQHCLWNAPEEIEKVATLVEDAVFPGAAEARTIFRAAYATYKRLEASKESRSNTVVADAEEAIGELRSAAERIGTLANRNPHLQQYADRATALCRKAAGFIAEIMTAGLG